ncbi:MAG TPA: hypothetical protein VKQ52_12185, partial [Puia sp.]|nr:hypothetical protein [Puia sp.]
LDKVKYGINLYKYDGRMKQLQQVGLQGSDKSFGPFPPRMTQFAGKLLIFYYQVADNGAIQLLYSAVDPESLDISAGKLLYSISEKNVGLFKLEKAVFGNKLRLCLSPDSSKLLVSQSGNTNEMFACTINADFSIEKPVVSKVKANMEDFVVESALIDGVGNRYFTYSFFEDKAKKNGVFVQNSSGKEGFLSFRANPDGGEPGKLSLQLSKDYGKAFVYGASSTEQLEEGVVLVTVDADGIKLGKPQLCSFPAELKDRLRKMDYTVKRHDPEVEKGVSYKSAILEDGTVVLTGFPEDHENHAPMISPGQHFASSISRDYAGPIFNIFIKDGKSSLGVIYRNQRLSPASIPIAIPYGNKLICIYTDSEKGIASDDPHTNDKVKDESDLVLAMAILNSDGTIISKKKLAAPVGSANFFTMYMQQLNSRQFLIPLGRERVNLARYYSELEEWATLDINP